MKIENFDKAIKSFKIVINDKASLFIDASEWYLALCYLHINDISSSNVLLLKISASGDYYSKQASALLEELH